MADFSVEILSKNNVIVRKEADNTFSGIAEALCEIAEQQKVTADELSECTICWTDLSSNDLEQQRSSLYLL